MSQPTEEQLYQIKADYLARKYSEAINEISNLVWQLDQQALLIQELKAANVSQENTDS